MKWGNPQLIIGANAVSNVGNGMDSLLIGMLLYQHSGSLSLFGSLLIVEYLLSALSSLYFAPLVDRFNPRQLLVLNEICRALLLGALATMVYYGSAIIWFMPILYALKLCAQLFQVAMFSMVSRSVPAQDMLSYSAHNASVSQAALLIGTAAVSGALMVASPAAVLAFDGMTFLVSALLLRAVGRCRAPQSQLAASGTSGQAHAWRPFLHRVLRNPSLLWHMALSASNSLAIALLNLSLAPLVAQRFMANNWYMTLFDGLFAMGAMAVVFVGKTLASDKYGPALVAAQGAAFLIIGMADNSVLIAAMYLLLGICNASSVVFFTSKLQVRGAAQEKGRLFGCRKIVISVLALICLPGIVTLSKSDLTWTFYAAGALMWLFSLSMWVLSRPPWFGVHLYRDQGVESL